MPVTLSQANFVHDLLRAAFQSNPGVTTKLMHVALYAQAQPATPNIDAGAAICTGTVATTGKWAAAAAGVLRLGNAIPVTANNSAGLGTVQFARFFWNSLANIVSQNGHDYGTVDLPVGLAGSGAPVILDTLSAGTLNSVVNITAFRVAFPLSIGTLRLNVLLANKLAEFLRGGSNESADTGDNVSLARGDGTFPAVLSLYSGAAPDTADLPASGTLLGSYTIPGGTELFQPPAGGILSLANPFSIPIAASGTAGYFRLTKLLGGSSYYVLQGAVGTSDTDLVLNTLTCTQGESVLAQAMNFGV